MSEPLYQHPSMSHDQVRAELAQIKKLSDILIDLTQINALMSKIGKKPAKVSKLAAAREKAKLAQAQAKRRERKTKRHPAPHKPWRWRVQRLKENAQTPGKLPGAS